jgi:hypothetical protein
MRPRREACSGAGAVESDVEKILRNADKLRFLGPNRAFVTLLFAIWANRKRGWLSQLMRIVLLGIGAGSAGYWSGFFS